MLKRKSNGKMGIGTLGIIQVIFIALKLCGLIEWHWAVVFIPLWIDLVLIVLIITVGVIVTLVKNRRLSRRCRDERCSKHY